MNERPFLALLCPLLAATALAAQPIAHDDVLVAIEDTALPIPVGALLANDEYFPFEPILSQWSAPQAGQLDPDGAGGFVYTPDSATFGGDAFTYSLSTTAGTSAPATVHLWTAPSRLALAGNWDGDGTGVDELAWFSNVSGRLFLCDGNTQSLSCALFTASLPMIGLDPLAMDWDGDGLDEVTFFDPTDGSYTLTDYSMAGGEGSLVVVGSVVLPQAAGQRPVLGDWNGDGLDTVGLYEPASGG